MSEMKVAYLIVSRTFPGLLKQIEYDRAMTSDMSDIDWDHLTLLDQVEDGDNAEQLPALCRGVFGMKFYAWLWLLKHAKRYDYVIVRHMVFDPFALVFARFVPNRILVHHSKEVLELRQIRTGWKGQAASLLERISGRAAVRSSTALLGVSHDICQYQRNHHDLPEDFPIGFFPNGVVIETMPLLGDERSNDIIEMGFICGSFTKWHGLDLLLDTLLDHVNKEAPSRVKLHLIGQLNEAQLEHVEQVNSAASNETIIIHGRLKQEEYLKILGRCHVGIGSLAMDRIQLADGSTLKVREMLAIGLPIYSGHKDTALPAAFPYYKHGAVEAEQIIDFARSMESVSRKEVREASIPYIDKRVWIEKLGDFLRDLKKSEQA